MTNAIRPDTLPQSNRTALHDADRNQRRGRPLLDEPEGDQEHGAGDQRAESGGFAPASAPARVRPKTRASRPPVTATAPGTSSRGRWGRPGIGDHGRRQDQHQCGHGHVDEEGPAPRQHVGEQAAQHRARGETGRHQRAVQAQRPVPQRTLLERGGQQRQAGRVTAAVASPWSTRAVSNISGDVAKPPSAEEAPRRAMPPRNSRLRPNRSAIRPKSRVKPAAVSANAVATHCRLFSEKRGPRRPRAMRRSGSRSPPRS